MPNRILKESICTSETIDNLSVEAETFFYRLMVQCDDFGRMDARPSVVRAKCFPLRLDRITDKQVGRWLSELQAADLLWIYKFDGRTYLQVTKWDKHQQKRAKHSKYPQPPERDINSNHLIADDSNSPREARSENTRDETSAGAQTAPGESDPIKELAAVFEQASGIKLESIPTKQRGPLYWAPLRLMFKTANGKAADELRAAVAHLRKDGMNISSPNSILKTFNSMHGAAITAPPSPYKDYHA